MKNMKNTARERFLKVLNFKKPEDRLPRIEWAAWWDETLERWQNEGLPDDLKWEKTLEYFNLDKLICLNAGARSEECPAPSSHGASIIKGENDYKEIKKYLYSDSIIENLKKQALAYKNRHENGEIIIRLWLDGYFWFPRTLFGIEEHLYAFYDQPKLMHQINKDLTEFNLRVIKELFPILKPDMIGFAEDMSYNNGPMLSYEQFKEFLTPYYQQVIPEINKQGIKVLVDSDGDITSMIPWLKEAGIEGIYPLEKQAGVDIVEIREKYPDFLMMGGYDKMVMSQGKKEMKQEFERILPVMKSGGYIPSVDHQTPPEVSLKNYNIYIKLFKEYTKKAVKNKDF